MIHLKKDLNDQINPELLKIVEEDRKKWITESQQAEIKYYTERILQGQGNQNLGRKGTKRKSNPLPTGEKLEKRIYDEWKVGVSILEISTKYQVSDIRIFEIIEKYKNEVK